MGYLGSWKVDDTIYFYAVTTLFGTGAATDADAAPSYRVYENNVSTALITSTMVLLDSTNTAGFYVNNFQATAAAGFEKGKQYVVYKSATVSSIVGVSYDTFQIEAEVDANAVSVAVGVSSIAVPVGVSSIAVPVGVSSIASPVGVSSIGVPVGVTTIPAVGVSSFGIPVGVSSFAIRVGVSSFGIPVGVSSFPIEVGVSSFGIPVGVSSNADKGGYGVSSIAALGLLGVSTVTDKSGYSLDATGSAPLTESYAADGATASINQLLYMIWSKLAEMDIASTTMTVKGLDGTTPVMTFTLNDATNPTSITRST